MKAPRLFAAAALMHAFMPWPEFLMKHPDELLNDASLQITFEKSCTGRGKIFHTSIAADEPTRRKGLSNRKNPLAPNEGMMFIFEAPTQASFWMKETLIPLQLIYVRADGSVLEAREMPVEKNPQNPKVYYTASQPILLAIELAPKSLKSTLGLNLCVMAPDSK